MNHKYLFFNLMNISLFPKDYGIDLLMFNNRRSLLSLSFGKYNKDDDWWTGYWFTFHFLYTLELRYNGEDDGQKLLKFKIQ